MSTQKATFAAGCFWGVEGLFRQLDIVDAPVGYTGGHTEHPTYREVCSGTTGHAEACEVTFDPSRISYDELVRYFYRLHDPTQVNRQGVDVGSQYRSAIFFHSPEQETIARAITAEVQAEFSAPIATQIVKAEQFWPAEAYHQRYFETHDVACHVLR